MNKYLKYSLKAVGILISVLLILYIVAYIYVSANKNKIIKQVTEGVSKRLNGKVAIGTVDLNFWKNFPSISVVLHDVSITDTMFSQHHHTFFTGEVVFAELSLIKFIQKQSALNGVGIEKAVFYLFTDTSGYTNKYLMNPKKDPAEVTDTGFRKNNLQRIKLTDVRFVINDLRKEKFHDFQINKLDIDLNDEEHQSLFFVKTDILVHSLAFNAARGSFVKEKIFRGDFDMRFNKPTKELIFDSINIWLAGHPFNITGRFELSGEMPQFNLRIHSKQMTYPVAKSLFPAPIAKSLSMVDIDKPVDVNADISGPLKGGDPLIYADWTAKNTHLTTPLIDFDSASFTGYFSDEVTPGLPRKDPNSKIVINNLTASWQGLPLISKNILILNLSEPTVTCDLKSNFALTRLNDVIESNSLQLLNGDGSIDLTYKGPIENYNNSNSFIDGMVSFTNGSILYASRNVKMENVNGKLLFKNSDVFVQDLRCEVLNNKVIMNGTAKNLLSLINTEPNKVNIDWNIFSPSLNLGAFTYLLKSGAVSAGPHKKGKVASAAKNIDNVLEEGKLNVMLQADHLIYKKFAATNVMADLSFLQDKYVINNVSLNHAGGRVNMKGSLLPLKNNFVHTTIDADLENVDVNKTFAAFDNFGQDGITAENLEGKLSAKISASMFLTDNGKVYPSSVVSTVDFSLKNGALNNYEPVKKVQKFIFKNRDFDNIRFAELKDRLEIKNQEVKINRMEIQSSVISIFVEGVFAKNGTTDMSIQVPLSNLKKRGDDYNPENIGVNKNGGTSIYLRGQPGPDGNVKFKLDLFKKFNKDKKKKANDF